VLIWLIALSALALAAASSAYSILRLKPTVLLVRDQQQRLASDLSSREQQPPMDDEAWRNDERRLSRLLDQQETALGAQQDEIQKLKDTIQKLKAKADTIDKQVSTNLVPQIEKLTGTVSKHEGALDRLPTSNATKWLTHSRLLSDDANKRIRSEMGPLLALEVTERHLFNLAHRVCMLEDRCHGRLATSIDTIVTRTVAALHLAKTSPNFRMLEIGTLYGIGAIAIYDVVRFITDNTHITLIDPLNGYYGSDAPDFASLKPVTLEVLQQNLAIWNVPAEDVTIIQGLSEGAEALEHARENEYDLLIIDGDHSEPGVRQDFENYFPLVRQGGLVVIDDYDVAEWPDIKKYADQKVVPRADVQVIFAGFRTLLLRKI
tara:strand:- start:2673 stop:3800 length:1128 start_codon:yes stop_codon:yes gene_type:complete